MAKSRRAKLEGLVVQEFWHEGELEDGANVTWLRVNGKWHDLCFEPGIVFWRRNWKDPFPLDEGVGDDAFYYPRQDLGKKYGVIGSEIRSCEAGTDESSTWVEIALDGMGTITLRHQDETESAFVELQGIDKSHDS